MNLLKSDNDPSCQVHGDRPLYLHSYCKHREPCKNFFLRLPPKQYIHKQNIRLLERQKTLHVIVPAGFATNAKREIMDLQQRVLRTDVSGMPLEWVGYQEAVIARKNPLPYPRRHQRRQWQPKRCQRRCHHRHNRAASPQTPVCRKLHSTIE